MSLKNVLRKLTCCCFDFIYLFIYYNTSDVNPHLLLSGLRDILSSSFYEKNAHWGHSLVALQALDPLEVHLSLWFPQDPVRLFVLLVLPLRDLGGQVSQDSLHMGGRQMTMHRIIPITLWSECCMTAVLLTLESWTASITLVSFRPSNTRSLPSWRPYRTRGAALT